MLHKKALKWSRVERERRTFTNDFRFGGLIEYQANGNRHSRYAR
jgi:hypothetical protein